MGKEVIQGLDGKHYMSRLCVCVGGGVTWVYAFINAQNWIVESMDVTTEDGSEVKGSTGCSCIYNQGSVPSTQMPGHNHL